MKSARVKQIVSIWGLSLLVLIANSCSDVTRAAPTTPSRLGRWEVTPARSSVRARVTSWRPPPRLVRYALVGAKEYRYV